MLSRSARNLAPYPDVFEGVAAHRLRAALVEFAAALDSDAKPALPRIEFTER